MLHVVFRISQRYFIILPQLGMLPRGVYGHGLPRIGFSSIVEGFAQSLPPAITLITPSQGEPSRLTLCFLLLLSPHHSSRRYGRYPPMDLLAPLIQTPMLCRQRPPWRRPSRWAPLLAPALHKALEVSLLDELLYCLTKLIASIYCMAMSPMEGTKLILVPSKTFPFLAGRGAFNKPKLSSSFSTKDHGAIRGVNESLSGPRLRSSLGNSFRFSPTFSFAFLSGVKAFSNIINLVVIVVKLARSITSVIMRSFFKSTLLRPLWNAEIVSRTVASCTSATTLKYLSDQAQSVSPSRCSIPNNHSILFVLDHGPNFRTKSLGKAVDQLFIPIRSLRRWDSAGHTWSGPRELSTIWRVIKVVDNAQHVYYARILSHACAYEARLPLQDLPAPAIFIFGDSTVDVGTNVFLPES
ncbi:hypothetical protein CRG98_023587 [Punica granatum]|uniref:Uncharacterized protein n=1 Tax=Punica granatum TaxID=22663 RepID=A0A2I0JJA9_PUNGR|nr:hypothetical protein CRG98_023587 [Punica granatum]